MHVLREIYIDESSQTKHRFLMLGGLITDPAHGQTFENMITDARGTSLPAGEVAWVKVSQCKLEAYKRFVSVFFDRRFPGILDFHSIVVDTHRIDDKTYNAGSRGAGFNKEIYQLILKFGRLYRHNNFNVYLDERSSSTPLEELRTIVNRGMIKNSSRKDWPVRRLHFRSSCSCHALQMVDVLLGALAFRLNGHRAKPEASRAKCELSDFVVAAAGIRDVTVDTSISGKLTVWHRRLQQPKRIR